MRTLLELADDLRAGTRPLLVCTGAGVSLASGIPTFRGPDPGAVWSADVTELGTFRFFRKNPVESWRWYLGRFDRLSDKTPNPGHHALVELEAWKRRGKLNNFLLVTQNIDGLHRKAGSDLLVEVHGNADLVRCPNPGCANAAPRGTLPRADFDYDGFRADPRLETLPRCPLCDAILRPHVLWFDEYYTEHEGYRYATVLGAATQVGTIIFVGTSFSVGVTANLLEIAGDRGVPVWNIDPGGDRPAPSVRVLPMRAEEALPELVALCRR